MSAVSALCRLGMHTNKGKSWAEIRRKGCWGTARDVVDGRYFDHPCACNCHEARPDTTEAEGGEG